MAERKQQIIFILIYCVSLKFSMTFLWFMQNYEMLPILICNVREHKWNEISNEARFDTFLVF